MYDRRTLWPIPVLKLPFPTAARRNHATCIQSHISHHLQISEWRFHKVIGVQCTSELNKSDLRVLASRNSARDRARKQDKQHATWQAKLLVSDEAWAFHYTAVTLDWLLMINWLRQIAYWSYKLQYTYHKQLYDTLCIAWTTESFHRVTRMTDDATYVIRMDSMIYRRDVRAQLYSWLIK